MTKTNKKNKVVLKKVLYIYYLLHFCKNKKNKVQALIDPSSKINAIIRTYVAKLGLKIQSIKVKAQKIDSSIFKMFKIVLIIFKIEDGIRKACFFQETFLLANINIKIDIFLNFQQCKYLVCQKKLT